MRQNYKVTGVELSNMLVFARKIYFGDDYDLTVEPDSVVARQTMAATGLFAHQEEVLDWEKVTDMLCNGYKQDVYHYTLFIQKAWAYQRRHAISGLVPYCFQDSYLNLPIPLTCLLDSDFTILRDDRTYIYMKYIRNRQWYLESDNMAVDPVGVCLAVSGCDFVVLRSTRLRTHLSVYADSNRDVPFLLYTRNYEASIDCRRAEKLY